MATSVLRRSVARALWTVVACATLLLAANACDSSSTIGLGVGPDSLRGGDPVELTVPVRNMQDTTLQPAVTSGLTLPIGTSINRVVAGRVDDPVIGITTAQGYVDFSAPRVYPPGYASDVTEIQSVTLELEPNYVYGDTTQPVELTVFDTAAEWSADSLRADTTLGRLGEITTLTYNPSDTLVTVDFPQSWIDANEPVLTDTSDSFANRFNGIALTHASGNAVVGFQRATAVLRVRTQVDTLAFTGRKVFSGVSYAEDGTLPQGRALLQQTTGQAAVFSLPKDEAPLDTLGQAPVNRARIVLPVDTLTFDRNTPMGFVRPAPNAFVLVARLAEGAPLCTELGLSFFDANSCAIPLVRLDEGLVAGTIQATGGLPTATLENLFERIAQDGPLFTRYRVQVASSQVAPNVLLLTTPQSTNAPVPRAELVVTPL
ncbi:DUF4270 family protein [Salisaeta longa]|uniref:DUF4270 family protein n=1 Tax=Salisaeta longa TaxID=503170 RepID=UPI0012FAB325|nr:DUF4270 family protein [Salisaeta longa]